MKKLTAAVKRRIARIKRGEHHPLIHKIHISHGISRKTIFYMKEYGKKSHVTSVIVKESLIPLVVSFALAIFGGVMMESIKSDFLMFIPLLILLPAMNDMIGSYSMIMVARLSTLVFTKGARGKWWASDDVKKMIITIFSVAVLSAIYIGLVSSIAAYFKGFPLAFDSAVKVLQVSLLTALVMVGIVVGISGFGVFYVYKRMEDPNNLVMPIMTSVADVGTIVTFALFVSLIF